MRSRRQIWFVLLWDRNMKMVWSWEEQGGDSHSTREVWGWLRSRALVSDAQSFQFRPQSHEVTPRREIWEGSQISWQSVRKAISVVKPPSLHCSGGKKKTVPAEQAQRSVLVSPPVRGLSVQMWASHSSSGVCDSLGQLLPVTDVGLAWPLV